MKDRQPESIFSIRIVVVHEEEAASGKVHYEAFSYVPLLKVESRLAIMRN